MRILHSVHDYLPEQVAGVEVYTSRLIAGQRDAERVGLLFARRDPAKRSGELETRETDGVAGFAVVQNRDWSTFEQTWLDRRLDRAFETVLERFDPDVLHVQHLLNLGIGLVEAANAMEIPIVMTLHDHWWSCANGGQRFRPDRERCDELDASRCGACTWSRVGPALALRRLIAAGSRTDSSSDIQTTVEVAPEPHVADRVLRVLRGGLSRHAPTPFGAQRIEHRWRRMRELSSRVDRFLVPSTDLAEAAIEFGYPSERIQVLPHGIATRATGAIRPAIDHARRFGYIGSIVPHKGVHHLVSAFDSLPEGSELSVHGSLDVDPAYVRELRALARGRPIRFLGPLRPESVPETLEKIDCLVAPSIWRENAPLIVQEAFVAGTPVIASDLGGHRELLKHGGGLLFEPGDEENLRAAMIRVATEKGLATRLAASAPPVRSLAEHVTELRGVYESVRRT